MQISYLECLMKGVQYAINNTPLITQWISLIDNRQFKPGF